MEKIYSKVESDKLLHIIVRKQDLKPGRTEVVSEEHFIQCALLNMKKDKTMQIIGRGQRPGRKGSLNVWKLCYNNELS